MSAFAEESYPSDIQIREVDIPNQEWEQVADRNKLDDRLELVFHYGQNPIQAVPQCYSVSVGDVIEFFGKLYMVMSLGFREITEEQYKKYIAIPLIDRAWIAYTVTKNEEVPF
jgi:hypothetical protein